MYLPSSLGQRQCGRVWCGEENTDCIAILVEAEALHVGVHCDALGLGGGLDFLDLHVVLKVLCLLTRCFLLWRELIIETRAVFA